MAQPVIVGIGGTTRANSSTEKALRFALGVCEKDGAETIMFDGPTLAALPHYAPENPERIDEARRLVEACRRADGLIVATPGYHGTISGLVKNALDYTEDMREDTRCYLTGMPIGLIATGAGWQGTVTTLESLRAIVHALRGWATPLGVAINSTQAVFGENGDVVDDKARIQIETMAHEVLSFVKVH